MFSVLKSGVELKDQAARDMPNRFLTWASTRSDHSRRDEVDMALSVSRVTRVRVLALTAPTPARLSQRVRQRALKDLLSP